MSRMIGLMSVRNEMWVLPYSLRAALTWVDAVVVHLHACTDASATITETVRAEHPGRVFVLEEPDPVWREMEHRQRMLETARAHGAQLIALVDADEVLAAPLRPEIRRLAGQLRRRQLLVLPWLNLWRSLDVYRRDGAAHGCGYQPLVFRDAFGICWMAGDDGYQHHHRAPYGTLDRALVFNEAGLMHLQRVSWRRARARQAWYKMIEVLHYPGRMPRAAMDVQYSAALDEDGARLHAVPPEWWAYEDLQRGLIDCSDWPDWQETEIAHMLAQHGHARFAGLDLFGFGAG